MIGDVGCEALATLLSDPNCNLHTLNVRDNDISVYGANALVKSLANNTKLKNLNLNNNPIDPSMIGNSLCKLLCNNMMVFTKLQWSSSLSAFCAHGHVNIELVLDQTLPNCN